MPPQAEAARGREAQSPTQVPGKGWKDVLLRVKDEFRRDNISIVAGGVAFFAMFALFPAIAATVAIYGLVASPQDVAQQMQVVSGMLPSEAQSIIQSQLQSASESSGGAMGFGAIIALLVALWSASRGMSSILTALNIAYNETDERSFFKLILLNLALTLGAIALLILALVMVAVVPALLGLIDLGPVWHWVISLARWPILFVIVLFALAVLYRVGPDRKKPQWRWASPGAVIATLLWVLGSLAFSFYVSRFGDYNATYGTIAGVVVLMMWLYISALVVLLGAEINSELERQTRRDTTDPGKDPMGQRGAYSADTLGDARGRKG